MKLILSFVLLFLSSITSNIVAQDKPTAKKLTSVTTDTLFAHDRITEIKIELAKKDWDTIRAQSRNFAEALTKTPAGSPFTYVKGDITIDGELIKNVGIRKKGFLGSLDSSRPSLKIHFSKYVKKQNPIKGLDRLTLNNNKQDPSRAGQFLTYNIFNESGTVAPRCGFAKVTVNGKYLGIYSNVESIRTKFLDHGFGDGSGDYFEGTITDFYPEWVQKFENKNKDASFSQIKKIAELLAEDEVDLDELDKLLDIKAFVKFWAMESLVGFWDGYCSNQNNFFIYQNPSNSKFYFIPWGLDSSLAKSSPIPPYFIRPRAVHAKAILPNKLYRIPKIQKLYDDTLMSFLDLHWNEEKLNSELDRVEKLLAEHVMPTNTKFKSTFRKFRSFVKTRRKDLMSEYKDGSPELKSREQSPMYISTLGQAQISMSTKWFEKTPRGAGGLGDVAIELTVRDKKIELEDVGAYAEMNKRPMDPSKPLLIVVSGKRKSDGKELIFYIGLSEKEFQPTADREIPVGGMFMEGKNFLGVGKMRFLGGQASFEKTSTKEGEPVVGKMTLNIVEMKGGPGGG